ncbi:MAG: CsoS2 family carboxysome shell protein [Gammaproteobacteria bacterium]|nr:CsoS2 family carboxysome shell protein [Gammaproteobacteria bacterium]
MSSKGKVGVQSGDRVRGSSRNASAPQAQNPAGERREGGCECGCKGEKPAEAPAIAAAVQARPGTRLDVSSNVSRKIAANPTRVAALARRRAQSTRGKAGVSAKGMTAAQTARAANPELSGRELAQTVRTQRSQRGNAGQKKSQPTGRVRPARPAATGEAKDQPWKVGASETSYGQTVTGTMVGRSDRVTGDEPSTCRNITGTEYLGADIFRDFCEAEPTKAPRKVRQSPTGQGNRVTGNEVGRSTKVTGDEPGTCKRVTGTEYVGADQSDAFCGTKPEPHPAKVSLVETRKGKAVSGSNVGRSPKVTGDEPGAGREPTGTQYMQAGDGSYPPKVGSSQTLRGGSVTGTMVGRAAKVTGDEPGSCRNVTGDDYVGQEQYQGFCTTTPAPQDAKVGASRTFKGETVTGTQTGRSVKVTGDEPGTCKAVTGTPYAGAEQYRSYCDADAGTVAAARARRQTGTPGSVMTGLQPGIDGKMTGAERGACEPLTGTPYVGADQYADACPATPAEPNSPDFPQTLGRTPWGQFSVVAPSHASQSEATHAAVTGSRYEQGHITGPFDKATGRVTGTEEARFGRGNGAAPSAPAALPDTAETVGGRIKSRVTGEGMDAGPKITGDDWDRGDRVTGTEGTSARGRNPTRRGPMSAMAMAEAKRNVEVPEPVSKVTGSSGTTERGALITYSGGARG